MVGSSRAERLEELAAPVTQRHVTYAGMPLSYQTIWGEFSVLIAIAAEPVAQRIVPRVAEAHGHAVAANSHSSLMSRQSCSRAHLRVRKASGASMESRASRFACRRVLALTPPMLR